MSSFHPLFYAAITLKQKGPYQFCHHINNDQDKYCSFLYDGPDGDARYRTQWPVSLVGPNFELADVAAGLPEIEAMLDALPYEGGDITVEDHHKVLLSVGVQVGVRGAEADLLAKKMATLVMVLEESLLLKLVAPSRYPRSIEPVSEESDVAKGPWPQNSAVRLDDLQAQLTHQGPGCNYNKEQIVRLDYYAHVPPVAAMKPAAWNNRDPERGWHILKKIWSTHSRKELESTLKRRGVFTCDFYLSVPEKPELPLNPSPCWTALEEGHTWFNFEYLQTTFEYTLFRNWVEVIARIVELTMAGPDEYKRCLEDIFRIQHNADQGGDVAWEQLMTHILKLEHRIPDWRDQLTRYERGEIIAGLSEDGMLPKRMGPYYSREEDYTALEARLRAEQDADDEFLSRRCAALNFTDN